MLILLDAGSLIKYIAIMEMDFLLDEFIWLSKIKNT